MGRDHRGERTLSAGMAALARRQLEIAAGVGLWALAAFALFSLATWNASDPSWSFAADTPVANAMGYPGAVVSDLLMQFFGVAALPALLPLVFWGYARMRALYWSHAMRRLILWPVAAVLTAAAIGCFSVTEHWPLPTGLGGVFGDMLLRVPGMLSGGYPSGWVRVFAFVLFAPAAAYALAVSCGFLWQTATAAVDEDADEETGLAGRFVFVGAAMHALYTARAMV
ncbi:MAG: DNA translocase FtsK 4TM domain-containing protein, partial [Oricola sp.]